jgi:DNA-binding transcriptional LysR family regulator
MLDFRLQVFYTVARRLNFTRAAAELFISQPAVTRHIKELEGEYRVSLFERSGNKKIILTPAGQMLLNYTEKLLTTYREMEYDMSLLNRQQSGVLRLGASTTVAQYIIPPILAKFHKKFNTVRVNLVSGNTEDIEAALLNKEIDAGIVEGIYRNPQLRYEEYLRDELVLVCAANNAVVKKDTIKPDELKNLPILLREHGSGTLDVLTEALKPFDIKLADLNIEMQLGSTEAIKSYLLYSNCVAFLSVHAILKELKNNECRIIDVKGLCVTRPFHFIQMHGHASLLAELFIRFTLTQTATII